MISRRVPARPSLLLSAALGIVLLTSACGGAASPADPITGEQTPAVESSAPETTAPQTSAPETSVALPDTFPSELVPLLPGVVLQASDVGGLWNLMLRPEVSLDGAPDAAQALMEQAGATLVGSGGDAGENRAYETGSYAVYINMHAEDGTVSYTVRER